jgi:hypothetical protein
MLRLAAAIVAGCALIGQAHADHFEAKLLKPQQIGSWFLSEPLIFIGEHERFFILPAAGQEVAPFGIGCSLGQYTLTFLLDEENGTNPATNIVLTLDGKQQVFMAERGKTEGTSPWTFAHLSPADLDAIAKAKTIAAHLQFSPTGAVWRVEGTASALKALAVYCAEGE